jgi:DNA-binding PadR family transcriptional regulator
LVLQERDREIVRLVADYRFITSEEIQALIPGSDQTILRRLQKLYHAGYLDRPRSQQQRGNAKMIYALGQEGAHLLAKLRGNEYPKGDWSEKNRQVRVQYLEHSIMVSRFRATLTLAARLNGQVALESWHQGQELQDEVRVEHPDWTERIPVCPDAFFVLRLTAEREGCNRVHVLLEADRGTMTLKRVLTKLRGYWHYWRSGKQEERFEMKNFLVLTVSRTTERSENLSAATQELDAPKHRGLRMFLFGSEQNYSLTNAGRILDPVWRTSGDGDLHSLLE